MVGLAIAAALSLAAPAPGQAPDTAAAVSAISVDNIREALQRPHVLRLPPVALLPDQGAVFRLRIEERPFPVDSVLEVMWRGIGESPHLPQVIIPGRASSPVPLVGVDLIRLAMGIANSLGAARRARAEEAARLEVQDALAAFCASHDCSVTEAGPNPHGEGILVPATPR